MTDLGDLGILPCELRKDILQYVLVEHNCEVLFQVPKVCINITECESPSNFATETARKTMHRSCYNPNRRLENISRTAILCASKAVSQEALQISYGCSAFVFVGSGTLAEFLSQIGSSRQHLRYLTVMLHHSPVDSFNSPEQWIPDLLEAKKLRKLEFELYNQFNYLYEKRSCDEIVRTLIRQCRPLLASLKSSIEARNLMYSVLDIVQIAPWDDDCIIEDIEVDEDERRRLKKIYQGLAVKIKREITEQLHLAR